MELVGWVLGGWKFGRLGGGGALFQWGPVLQPVVLASLACGWLAPGANPWWVHRCAVCLVPGLRHKAVVAHATPRPLVAGQKWCSGSYGNGTYDGCILSDTCCTSDDCGPNTRCTLPGGECRRPWTDAVAWGERAALLLCCPARAVRPTPPVRPRTCRRTICCIKPADQAAVVRAEGQHLGQLCSTHTLQQRTTLLPGALRCAPSLTDVAGYVPALQALPTSASWATHTC